MTADCTFSFHSANQTRPMNCQRCSKAKATVHLTESRDGRVKKLDLCERCARLNGLPVPEDTPSLPLDDVVQELIVAHVGELVGELARRVCPLCGLKFMEFRISGRLGCPNDYAAFDRGLTPLLRRSHEGVTRHVGKTPKRAAGPEAARSLKLRAQLRAAIALEDYEEAARLRDCLRPKDASE